MAVVVVVVVVVADFVDAVQSESESLSDPLWGSLTSTANLYS